MIQTCMFAVWINFFCLFLEKKVFFLPQRDPYCFTRLTTPSHVTVDVTARAVAKSHPPRGLTEPGSNLLFLRTPPGWPADAMHFAPCRAFEFFFLPPPPFLASEHPSFFFVAGIGFLLLGRSFFLLGICSFVFLPNLVASHLVTKISFLWSEKKNTMFYSPPDPLETQRNCVLFSPTTKTKRKVISISPSPKNFCDRLIHFSTKSWILKLKCEIKCKVKVKVLSLLSVGKKKFWKKKFWKKKNIGKKFFGQKNFKKKKFWKKKFFGKNFGNPLGPPWTPLARGVPTPRPQRSI